MRSSLQTGCQAALQNIKTLLLLQIQLLLGCYVEWLVPPPQDSADLPVLSTACDDADADESAEQGGSSGGVASTTSARTRAGGGAATATLQRAAGAPSRGRTGVAAGPDSGGSATSPAAAAPAADPPAAAAPGVLDVKDLTTWTQGTWELLSWDEIHFPKDPNVNICSVRQVLSVLMPVGVCQ
jgi:hypothetical protein